MAERFDISVTKKWKMDGRNRLIVEATPTRAGVFTYYDQSGKKVRELRHPDDVFSKETLDSLNGIPYTTQSNHVSLMTPEDITGKTYGYTLSDATRVDDHAAVKLKINDGKEIKAVMGGESLELSNGYTCDVVKESGEYNGEKYDARQKNIIYDHVARVEKARGGDSCRIRLDSADSAICGIEAERLDNSSIFKNSQSGDKMTEKIEKVTERELPARELGEFRLDALTYVVSDESKSFADREGKLFAEMQRLQTEVTKSQVKMDQLETENKDLSTRIEGSISKEKLDQEIDKRSSLYMLAEKVGIKDPRKIDINELQKEVVKESGVFTEPKLDNADWVSFALEHLQTKAVQKVMKSRENLAKHQDIKFDSDNDLSKPSKLEIS